MFDYLTRLLGGSPSRKILRFNTIVFRKDKWGIISKVIIRTSKIRVLWGLKVVPIGRNKGRELGTQFTNLLSNEIRVNVLVEIAHDKEFSLSPKLTMPMNFYFQMLFQTDK